jgi:hypothetical protein
MTESSQTGDDTTEEEFASATAGPGALLGQTSDADDHEDMLAAINEHDHPQPHQDIASTLEDIPSATAGPAELLALTVDQIDHDA